jgi:hypothetical protein
VKWLLETGGTVMAFQQQHPQEIHAFLDGIFSCKSKKHKWPGVRGGKYPEYPEVIKPFLMLTFTKEEVEHSDFFCSQANYEDSTSRQVLMASTMAAVFYHFLVRTVIERERERAPTMTKCILLLYSNNFVSFSRGCLLVLR